MKQVTRSHPLKVWRKNVQGPGNGSGEGPGVSDELTSRPLGLEHVYLREWSRGGTPRGGAWRSRWQA